MDMKARVLGILRGTDLLIGTRQRLAREIADAHAVELQKALDDQREGIARALDAKKDEAHGSASDPANHSYRGHLGGKYAAYEKAADIARNYGQNT